MNPENIPFNALISGPTNCGKTKYLVNLLSNEFRFKFDYIVLLCPTFFENETYSGVAENGPDFFVITPDEEKIDLWLKFDDKEFNGTNTLISLYDCAVSKDLKQRSNELVKLAFSVKHSGISVWVLTQQLTSNAKVFRENVAALILFFTPLANHREQLAALVASGQAKEMIGVDLTQDQVKKTECMRCCKILQTI